MSCQGEEALLAPSLPDHRMESLILNKQLSIASLEDILDQRRSGE